METVIETRCAARGDGSEHRVRGEAGRGTQRGRSREAEPLASAAPGERGRCGAPVRLTVTMVSSIGQGRLGPKVPSLEAFDLMILVTQAGQWGDSPAPTTSLGLVKELLLIPRFLSGLSSSRPGALVPSCSRNLEELWRCCVWC